MARPAKSVAAQAKTTSMTKEEKEHREKIENLLKGKADKLKPPRGMSKKRKDIFDFVLSELAETNMLGNLDIFVLEKLCISVDMLKDIDAMIDENNDYIMNAGIRNAREMYSRDFFRCCNELCMSPQSRAKFSISSDKSDEPKSIREMLMEDDED